MLADSSCQNLRNDPDCNQFMCIGSIDCVCNETEEEFDEYIRKDMEMENNE
jgi:hypothetical protein